MPWGVVAVSVGSINRWWGRASSLSGRSSWRRHPSGRGVPSAADWSESAPTGTTAGIRASPRPSMVGAGRSMPEAKGTERRGAPATGSSRRRMPSSRSKRVRGARASDTNRAERLRAATVPRSRAAPSEWASTRCTAVSERPLARYSVRCVPPGPRATRGRQPSGRLDQARLAGSIRPGACRAPRKARRLKPSGEVRSVSVRGREVEVVIGSSSLGSKLGPPTGPLGSGSGAAPAPGADS